jgi:GH15 family glucan-1,4-alpha-glucosidase
MREFNDAAKEIKAAAAKHLFSSELQSFIRIATMNDNGTLEKDLTVDSSSLFGLWYFGMYDQTDPLFQKTLEQTRKRLSNPTEQSGMIRYERDNYFKSTDLSNPWIITTLWEAQRRLSAPTIAQEDLTFAESTFEWVVNHMYESGVLAEQLNPYTGESLSATPLVWSHAVYIETVLLYCKRKGELAAGPVPVETLHEL